MKFIQLSLAVLGLATLSMFGCSKAEFKKTEFSGEALPPGLRSLPGKVDILLVLDNSSSMIPAFDSVESQLRTFVNSMKDRNWDYHIAKSMIINPQDINQVLVNPSLNSATLPDGSPNFSTDLVPANFAVGDIAPMLPLIRLDNSTGAVDKTFENTLRVLSNAAANPTMNFLRNDALFAVVIFTNGTENSLDSNLDGILDAGANARLQDIAIQLSAFKNLPDLIRYYPVAAGARYPRFNGDFCFSPGATALSGNVYYELLNFFKGVRSDFCDFRTLPNVLATIDQDLTTSLESFIFGAIVLDSEPLVGSIKLFKNGQQIPNSASDGWTYEGQGETPTVVAIIDKNGVRRDIQMFRRSGYVIRLHGSAEFKGSDTPQIEFQKP